MMHKINQFYIRVTAVLLSVNVSQHKTICNKEAELTELKVLPAIIPFVHDSSSLCSQLCQLLTNLQNKCNHIMHKWNVECDNVVFNSKQSAICAKAVYFLHSTMPSVTCLWLSDVSVICRVTYFQFPIQVCFSSVSVSQAAQRRTLFIQYQTSDVAKKVRQVCSGNDFELF